MSIDYPRFDRLIVRSGDLISRADVIAIVKTMYLTRLALVGDAFRAAHTRLRDVEVVRKKERREGLAALAAIEQPFIEARTAAAVFITDLALPKTLASLPTETDKRDAIARLLEILDAHDDEPGWAKDLTDGPFGHQAPTAIREISEWIAANGDLEKAVRDRMAAYAAAYPRFLEFREQVRASYGKSSVHYRRLLVRSNGKLAVEDPTDVDSTDTGVTDSGAA